MLAQNFKTPADLKIPDKDFEALVKVLGMLERGEIKQEQFDMNTTGRCGSPMCILGWARQFGGRFEGLPGNTVELFLYKFTESFFQLTKRHRDPRSIEPEEAAIALRSYLSTGEPQWAAVFDG